MKPIIAVVGPTATGKSDLAIHLALKYGGEVVSADSRQVYRHMDIGTAKITAEEQVTVPHYFIDIKNLGDKFSLAEYQDMALEIIADIQQRGKIPVLAGGTGQYVWAILEGWEIPRVEPDLELRRELEDVAKAGEADQLYKELQEKDPEAAASIDHRNVRRVIRALEVVRQTNQLFSRQKTRKQPPYETLIIGLTAERKLLYHRIDTRVDDMIEQGFIEEVKNLLDMGVDPGIPAMSGIGYKQIVMHLDDKLTLDEAVFQIKVETHRLVRRQYNWFKLIDERIHWLDIEDNYYQQAEGLVEGFLGSEF